MTHLNHKNLGALALMGFLILSLPACKKEFLDINPLVGSTEANFYQTPEDAQAAVIACYNPLQQEVTNIQGSSELAPHFRWYFGDIVSDDSHKGGSGDGDEPQLFLFENFQGNGSSKLVLGEWQAAYKGIAYCNLALARIPGIEMDEDLKARYLAEAKFIRAYWYMNLVTMFGGVPLVLEPLAPSQYQQARNTAGEIWTQIEQDLSQARGDLPFRTQLSTGDLGRATWGAATGMLVRAHIYQGEWAPAKDLAEEVVGSGEYDLDPDYGNIFKLSGENGPGSMFEIQFMNASGGNWGNSLEGTFTNVFQRARGQFGGYGFNIPTADFINEFEGDDPRLSATVFQVGDVMGDRGIFDTDATGMPHLYYPKKYFINQADEAPFGDPNPNGPSNDRVLRYADLLLMHAEAAYHVGDEEAARSSLNEVRQRAFGDSNHNVDASGPFLLDAIYHERRVELGLEGHRFFDLVRQGRAADVLSSLGFQAGKHELFPIPEAEITLSDNLITQNPGY
ncbi:MAG: RagB/SusD family nutrient uptake outer membrane protein [Flavobacteriales bacterium]